jgi:hypothetical protein
VGVHIERGEGDREEVNKRDPPVVVVPMVDVMVFLFLPSPSESPY